MSKAKKQKSKSNRHASLYWGIPPGAKSAKEVFRHFQYVPRQSVGTAVSSDSEQVFLDRADTVQPPASNSKRNNERAGFDKSELSSSGGPVISEPSKNDNGVLPANGQVTPLGNVTKSRSEGRQLMYEPIAPVALDSYNPGPLVLAYKRKMQIKREAELKEYRRDRNIFLILFFTALTLVVNLETNLTGRVWGFMKEKFGYEQKDEMNTIKMTKRKQLSTSARTSPEQQTSRTKRR